MSTPHGLFLLSHDDMQTRPDRTERALRVFFPVQAKDYFAALHRGDSVLIRYGARDALGALAGRLGAHGFNSSVRKLETID